MSADDLTTMSDEEIERLAIRPLDLALMSDLALLAEIPKRVLALKVQADLAHSIVREIQRLRPLATGAVEDERSAATSALRNIQIESQHWHLDDAERRAADHVLGFSVRVIESGQHRWPSEERRRANVERAARFHGLCCDRFALAVTSPDDCGDGCVHCPDHPIVPMGDGWALAIRDGGDSGLRSRVVGMPMRFSSPPLESPSPL